jgi:hypothetical protein
MPGTAIIVESEGAMKIAKTAAQILHSITYRNALMASDKHERSSKSEEVQNANIGIEHCDDVGFPGSDGFRSP